MDNLCQCSPGFDILRGSDPPELGINPPRAGFAAHPEVQLYLKALSPTPRQPLRLSFRRNPPHLLEMFSTTRPWGRQEQPPENPKELQEKLR